MREISTEICCALSIKSASQISASCDSVSSNGHEFVAYLHEVTSTAVAAVLIAIVENNLKKEFRKDKDKREELLKRVTDAISERFWEMLKTHDEMEEAKEKKE